MDNQHKKIAGYRDLSLAEIDSINRIKDLEYEMGEIIAEIHDANTMDGDHEANRWTSIARTHLETGFMFAIKAVARPTSGLGRR